MRNSSENQKKIGLFWGFAVGHAKAYGKGELFAVGQAKLYGKAVLFAVGYMDSLRQKNFKK